MKKPEDVACWELLDKDELGVACLISLCKKCSLTSVHGPPENSFAFLAALQRVYGTPEQVALSHCTTQLKRYKETRHKQEKCCEGILKLEQSIKILEEREAELQKKKTELALKCQELASECRELEK